MVVRLHNLSKWTLFEPGQVIALPGIDTRLVRVEFNCEAPTRLDVVDGLGDDAKSTFVAVISGLEAVELTVSGDTWIAATSEGEVWFFTNEADDVGVDHSLVSFTKIASRKARNPQLEMMMFRQQQNMERRMAALQGEMDRKLAAMAAAAGADPVTGEIEDDGNGDGASAQAASGGEGAAAGDPEPADEGADDGASK